MSPNFRRAAVSVKNRISRAGASVLCAIILAGGGQSAAALDLGNAQVLPDPNLTIGFSTYSEGVNDDVNKIVWSSLGWNPDQPMDTKEDKRL